MERIRQIWIESARSSSTIESCSGSGPMTLSSTTMNTTITRPPPLRTSSTYDDDDAFNNVALNLLSRHEILGLSAVEAILSTLVNGKQRASFYEGLCLRLDRSAHLSPNTASLVYSLEKTFGQQLKEMTMDDSVDYSTSCHHYAANKPHSPRHHFINITSSSSRSGNSHSNNQHRNNNGATTTAMPTCRNAGAAVAGLHKKKSTPTTRRFFPDCSDKSQQQHYHGVLPTIGLFGGGNKRRVRNIDWKVAEAIQQVNRLQLDDACIDTDGPNGDDHQYTSTASNTATTGYEPPRRF